MCYYTFHISASHSDNNLLSSLDECSSSESFVQAWSAAAGNTSQPNMTRLNTTPSCVAIFISKAESYD